MYVLINAIMIKSSVLMLLRIMIKKQAKFTYENAANVM
jgi:hypothetical protein